MQYSQYTITASGGTLNTYLDNSYVITSPAPVTLTASFAIVPTSPIPYSPIKIRWNTNVNLGIFGVTIGGIAVNQDQVNQTGTFELMWDGTSYFLQYFPDFTKKPQETYGVTTVTVPVGGGTLTITPGKDPKTYVLQGTVTLTSNYTVTAPVIGVTNGSAVRVVVSGGITTGSNTVTIFGKTISKFDCLNGGVEVFAEFNATTAAYVATYVNKPIPLGNLDTTGYVVGDNGKVVSYDSATNSFISSFLSASNLASTFKGINITTTTISSAQILTAFSSPITLLPASGFANIVEVPLMFIVRYIAGGTPYATNTTGVFEYTGPTATVKTATKTGMLTFAASGLDVIMPDNFNLSGSANILLTPNFSLTFRTQTGNPTAGNGSMVIYTLSTTLNI
jgi:hypothetical protein